VGDREIKEISVVSPDFSPGFLKYSVPGFVAFKKRLEKIAKPPKATGKRRGE